MANMGYIFKATSRLYRSDVIHRSNTNCLWLFSADFSTFSARQAGHSHWQNIRHIKGERDMMKQKNSGDTVRKIKIAVTDGGGVTNPKLNAALARVLEEGKAKDVPSIVMTNAIQKLEKSKNMKGAQLFVEARGLANCALIVEGQTERQKWLRQQIQHTLKQFAGRVGDSGASANFHFKGVVYCSVAEPVDLDKAVEAGIEAGAEEVLHKDEDQLYQFICDPQQLHVVKKSLQDLGYRVDDARQEFLPHTYIRLDPESLDLASDMIDRIEAIEEVVRVYHNIEAASES